MPSETSSRNRVLENMFLREKPAKILLGMKVAKDASYASVLAKQADCTYSHTIKILNLFSKLGMVGFEKSGRIKRVTLTDSGWDIAHNLEAMVKRFAQIVVEDGLEKEQKEKPEVAGRMQGGRPPAAAAEKKK